MSPAAMKLDDDDFALFGLPQRQRIDRAELDARWRRLQAEVHPDRHASQGAAAQRVAMQWAVRVNQAYQRLKDPLQRGAYLCALRGVPVDAERNTAMPPAFLQQQMAWRESLDDAADAAAVEDLDAQVAAAERELFDELETVLDAGKGAGNGADAESTAAAAERVRALMFVSRFREAVARRLEALESRAGDAVPGHDDGAPAAAAAAAPGSPVR